MRRLPVYFVIDVSESMVGEKIKQVEDGMSMILTALRSDPYALETVYISVILFAGNALVAAPLTDVCTFNVPPLPIGSGTSLKSGLEVLMRELDTSVKKTTKDTKGDWKPLIFLFTDGMPTDNPSFAIARWNKDYAAHATLVAVSIGRHADTGLLANISNNVLRMAETNSAAFKTFFRWVTASIQASSASVAEYAKDGAKLPSTHGNDLENITDRADFDPEDDCVVLPVKCSRKKELYLMRYEKKQGAEDDGLFHIKASYPVSLETYERLSAAGGSTNVINTRMLCGITSCPYCGNPIAMACECGNLSCSDPNYGECAWCDFCGELGPSVGANVFKARG